MREVGEEFPNDSVSWLQIYMFEFGFGQIQRPKEWKGIVLDSASDPEAEEMHKYGGELVWHTTIPVDQDRLWDTRGSYFFVRILQRNHRLCNEFLNSREYQEFLRTTKVDLVIVDHFIQECFTVAASLLNTTTVQYSNWPIADGYISSLNIPSNPSSVPRTSTPFSSVGMTFVDRLRNSFFNFCIVAARTIQGGVINNFYRRNEYPNVDLFEVEASHLLYVGRSEFLFEPIRPINNRVKHFGCSKCRDASEYRIKQPLVTSVAQNERPVTRHAQDCPKLCPSGAMQSLKGNTTVIALGCSCQRSSRTEGALVPAVEAIERLSLAPSLTELELRYASTQNDFPELDLSVLEKKPFILVSFGSVTKVEAMPTKLLDTFLSTFGSCNRTVVWQTNSDTEHILSSRQIPANVHLLRWAPLKVLLGHHNLQYAVLHGGINTVNEVLLFGVPILGVPLQGDQPSNIRRLVDLGMGEIIDIKGIWYGELQSKMDAMEERHDYFARRAKKVASMIQHYHQLSKNSQHFWLHWAKRNGRKVRRTDNKLFHFRYRPLVEHFALAELGAFFLVLTSAMAVIRL